MARLFISCNHKDFEVGKRLERALIERGHVMTLRVDARPAGRWEAQLLHALHRADAFIPILTAHGEASSWVTGQTGMAVSCEYTKHTLVLPVCPRGHVPSFVSSFHCFWLTDEEGRHVIEVLATQLDEAIAAYQARRPPRIFISHRHQDKDIARGVIDLLETAFEIPQGQIRCTSVPGYKLAVGAHSADSLQTDLNGAEIVMGLIGKDTADSDYVLFELGASWGLRKPTFPLRICGATFTHVPEVLRERSSLTLEDVSQCLQLVEDVARISSLTRREESEATTAAVRRQAETLARAAQGPAAALV